MASDDMLERAAWSRRAMEFGAVRVYDDGARDVVIMEFRPRHNAETDEWRRLSEVWLDLPRHPNLLDALDRDGDTLLLRYAALDWRRDKLRLQSGDQARSMFASWAVQVTEAFRLVASEISADMLGELLVPFVMVDVGNQARLGFLPACDRQRADTDEHSLTRAIGNAMRTQCVGLYERVAIDIRKILDRCNEAERAAQYASLEVLRRAWGAIGSIEAPREGKTLSAWMLAEEGCGRIALDDDVRARELFDEALAVDERSRFANQGRLVLEERATSVRKMKPVIELQPWPSGEAATWSARGKAFEDRRSFGEALVAYRHAHESDPGNVDVLVAIARCHLAAGETGPAFDFAERALAIKPGAIEALAIRARSSLLRGDHEGAVVHAEAWSAVAPLEGAAHYVRGRALYLLMRLAEARDAFDRACVLRPRMIEAMVLRREVDRAMARVRDAVGVQPKLEMQLPPHLYELRPLFLAGRIGEVIETLAGEKYRGDSAAQLLCARCMAFDKRFEDAAAIFDGIARTSAEHAHAALVGEAYALLALDRVTRALSLFDRACAEMPADVDAVEGRSRALRELGRDVEADDDLRRALAAPHSSLVQT